MQQLDPQLPVPEWPSATCSYMEPVEFPVSDRNAFQRVFKKAKKANARATKLREAHDAWRYAAELARSPGEYVLCSIDIEAWEQDHSILLEIGWTLYDTRTDRYMDQHYLISSYRHLSNGRYVDDQKLRFGFGTSVWCTLPQALAELKKDLDWCVMRDGGFVLVGHGLDSDLKYLRQAKFLWPGRHPGVDDTLDIQQSALITIINTDVLYAASVNDLHNPPSLGRTLSLFGIDHWCLHNAGNIGKGRVIHGCYWSTLDVGNDAHYTMVLLKALVAKLDDTTSWQRSTLMQP